jgi:succinate dehydrogenase / fumarate reductase cytochrome b subunit
MSTSPIPVEPGQPRPYQPTRVEGVLGWFNLRRRGLGSLAFVLNRLTGLGLVVYLFVHLLVLSLLAQGPSAWDEFVRLARSPLFLLLDVVLFAGIFIHGLNGIRVTLVGLGIGVARQKMAFVGLMAAAALLLMAAILGVISA